MYITNSYKREDCAILTQNMGLTTIESNQNPISNSSEDISSKISRCGKTCFSNLKGFFSLEGGIIVCNVQETICIAGLIITQIMRRECDSNCVKKLDTTLDVAKSFLDAMDGAQITLLAVSFLGRQLLKHFQHKYKNRTQLQTSIRV